jgi:hypothetical protein
MTERPASKLRAGSAIGMAVSQLERDKCPHKSPVIAAAFWALRPLTIAAAQLGMIGCVKE